MGLMDGKTQNQIRSPGPQGASGHSLSQDWVSLGHWPASLDHSGRSLGMAHFFGLQNILPE